MKSKAVKAAAAVTAAWLKAVEAEAEVEAAAAAWQKAERAWRKAAAEAEAVVAELGGWLPDQAEEEGEEALRRWAAAAAARNKEGTR